MKTDAQRARERKFIERVGKGLYSDTKHFADGECAWLARMVYTCAILYGLTPSGHRDRWCYHTMADAKLALEEWDGVGEPEGWHRHPMSGRRYDEAGHLYVQP